MLGIAALGQLALAQLPSTQTQSIPPHTGGRGYVSHSFSRKRFLKLRDELRKAADALLAKADKAKPEQKKAISKAVAATENVIGVLGYASEEMLDAPVFGRLELALRAAEVAKTRSAVVAQTTAAVRIAELIIAEIEDEDEVLMMLQ